MKILITGGKGMLGKTLQRELADHDLVIADLPDVDILRGDAFSRLVSDARPGARRLFYGGVMEMYISQSRRGDKRLEQLRGAKPSPKTRAAAPHS